jgi:RHS repeat-associated protein
MAADNNLYPDVPEQSEQSEHTYPQLFEIREGKMMQVKQYAIQNSARWEVLQTVVEDAISSFPARTYGLILWSHGTGWLLEYVYDMLKQPIVLRSFGRDWSSEMNIFNKAMYIKKKDLFSTWGEFSRTYTYWMRSTGTALTQVSSATSSNSSDALDRSYTLVDFNGDGKTDLAGYGYNCYNGSSTRTMRLYTNSSVTPATGMITSITDGYGRGTTVNYASLTSNIYTKGSGSVYPVMDCVLPVTAVKSITSDNGAAGTTNINYKYGAAKVHLTGKGLLGMTQTVNNVTMGTTVESGVKTLNPKYFAPDEVYTKTTVNGVTAETSVNYTFVDKSKKKYFMYPNKKTEKDLDGNTVTATYKYDEDYGNITGEKTEWSSNMYRQVTYGDYIQAGGTMKDKPQLITEVSKHVDDSKTFTRKTRITYNTTKGYPTKKIENYDSSLPLTTEYTYDEFGNMKSYKVSGKDIKTVTYNIDYDPTNRFVAKTYSSPAHTVTSFTYNAFGNVLTEKDETNSAGILTTKHTYDNWGCRTSTLTPDNNKISYSTGWGNVLNQTYFVLTQAKGQPWIKTWYDKTGRETAVETIGPKGMKITATSAYNTKGELSQRNTRQGSLSISRGYSYDARSRVTSQNINGQEVTYFYGNRKVTTTVAGKEHTKTYDAWGGIKQIDDSETTVKYTYCSSGQPSKVSAAGADFYMTYDNAGNQITLKDPNAGTITYTYNAAGGVKTQVDGKGKKTEHFPDNLNRNSYSVIDGTRTDYSYGESGYDLHRLTKVKTGNNLINYTYDKYGRLQTEKRQIDGGGELSFGFEYNTNGQIETVTYPDNIKIKQEYDACGNLVKVLAGTQSVWELTRNTGLLTATKLGGTMTATNSYNSQGLLTNQRTVKGSIVLRNSGYSFNSSTGNLDSRTGMINQTETFLYDSLDRLTSIKHAGTEVMKINYNPNGNISNKTGLGTYSYHSTKKHAITGVDNTAGLISTEEQNIAYTAFNKAYNIKEKVSNNAYELNIAYGPDQQRWKSVLKKNNAAVRTVVYAGDYEKITENGVTQQLYYISGGDGLAAIYVKQPGQTDKIYYAHRDHLGSILSLTDNAGTAVFKASYDAWGKQTVTANTFKFHRGYTGHEHLPEFALINMNGRMYDPILGRFLSPDPYVQTPGFSQSFNRYSYCVNNPLIYTDPDGEIAWFVPVIIGAAIGAYSGGVIANDGQYNPVKWDYSSGKTWGYMLGGAAVGGLSGYAGWAVATSGVPMANTLGITTSSFMNSVGTAAYTGGQTPVSISLGVASYDFTNNRWGYLGKKGNKWHENVGYGLGAMANLSDILTGLQPKGVDLVTEHSDKSGHSAMVKEGTATGVYDGTDPNALISVGPDRINEPYGSWHWMKGTNGWDSHSRAGEMIWRQNLKVNMGTIEKYSRWLNARAATGKLVYSVELSSCVTHTSTALNLSGIFNIGIHPYLLNAQMYLWSNGIRPWTFNYFLNH